METDRMYVLLADAHPKVRWALRTVIGEEPGLTMAGEVSNSERLLDQARELKPDLIVLDWDLPGQPGEELLVDLANLNQGSRVFVLSSRPEARQAALAAGANAFVSKASGPDQLLAALREFVRE
jgi:DNA-binding NarL/FixJ family response regulator